jgi:hypothetical protein
MYGATHFDCAACETVFNDHLWMPGLLTVPKTKLKQHSYSLLVTRREFVLASLHSPDLKVYGTRKADIIESDHRHTSEPRQLAERIYEGSGWADGLVWTSRANDAHLAYMFFGDRVSRSDFRVSSTVNAWGDRMTRLRLIHLARRFRIDIV